MDKSGLKKLALVDFGMSLAIVTASVMAFLTLAMLGPRVEKSTAAAMAIIVFLAVFVLTPVVTYYFGN